MPPTMHTTARTARSRVFLTPIACSPDFSLLPLLKRAVEEESTAGLDLGVEHLPFECTSSPAEDPFDPWCARALLCMPNGAVHVFSRLLFHNTPVHESVAQRCVSTSIRPGATAPLAGHKRSRADFDGFDSVSSPPPSLKRQHTQELRSDNRTSSASTPSTSSAPPDRTPTAGPLHASANPPGSANCHTLRRRDARKAYRKKKKDEKARQHTSQPRRQIAQKYLAEASQIPTDIDIFALPSNSSGYEGKTQNSGKKKAPTWPELQKKGYNMKKWDGRSSFALTDNKTKKIVAFGVAMPNDPTWQPTCKQAADIMLERGRIDDFTADELKHKRGRKWPAVNAGFFCGQGPPRPYNLRHDGHEETVKILLDHPAIQRLAAHQSASFQQFAPKVYDYYHIRTRSVLERFDYLKPNFIRSVFAAAAFNLGPQVTTFLHRDCMNCPFGWCAVHALGEFDHTKGGHLVLDELKLVIEFPPGALILLPSAVITHGNTPIQEGETRVSFTQYTSGAIFRFYDNGFRTEAEFREADEEEYIKAMAEKAGRWEMGLGLWSTVDDLLNGKASTADNSGDAVDIVQESAA